MTAEFVAPSPTRSRLLPLTLVFWLLCTSVGFTSADGNSAIEGLTSFLGFIPAALVTWQEGHTVLTRQSVVLLALLILPAYLSSFIAGVGTLQLFVPLAIIPFAMAGSALARSPRAYLFVVGGLSLSLALLPLIRIALHPDDLQNFYWILPLRRFDLGMEEPNSAGLVGTAMVVASLSLQSRWLRYLICGLGLLVTLWAWSRNSIMTAGFAIACAYILDAKRRRPAPGTVFGLAALCALIAYVEWDQIDGALSLFLRLDDPSTGLDSGFSGRSFVWAAALRLWLENILFGVGFGEHVAHLGFGYYAHNMALVLLDETGIVGFSCFFGAAVYAVYRLVVLKFPQRRDLLIALIAIASYWVFGIFEGKGISAGNPYSGLYFLSLFYAVNTGQTGDASETELELSERFA
jgi:O-antigen ligase